MHRTTGEGAKRRLDTSIRLARATVRAEDLDAYDRLLAAAWTRSDLLSRRYRAGPEINVALVAFARFAGDFVRSPESFVQGSASPRAALAELAAHLFARYPMPPPMTSAWLEGELGEERPEHLWYVRLGRGESLRALDLPIATTRRAAHLFGSAPAHLGVFPALRWAEVRALGATEELAAAVIASRLGRVADREDVHRPLLELLVRENAAPEHVGPIVDFVRGTKIEERDGFRPDGTYGRLPPPWPDLAIRGRTVASLLRLADAWHVELGRAVVRSTSWAPSSIRPLRVEETIVHPSREPDEPARRETRIFTIEEIVTSHDLVREGRDMRHCVGSYVGECLAGRTTIWSLRVASSSAPAPARRLVTLEVDPKTRVLRQARRRLNARPGETERALVARWAERERITIDRAV